MKFAAEFQEDIFPPWRLSYVSYDRLNEELKNRLSNPWTDKDELEFTRLLDNELSKAYDFTSSKLAEVDARIIYCERTIQSASQAIYTAMEEALTDILFDINDLSKFTRTNYRAIQKLLKKHDRSTGRSLQETFIEKLREKPLDKQRFDVALVYISALQDMCRNRGKTSSTEDLAVGQETSTFWIHPDNVTEVKSILMLHLPVHIYNTKKKFESSDAAVSTVYLDNSDFDLYTGRLQRDELAETLGLKWYGSRSSEIYIEKEIYQDSKLDKDRFQLPEKQVGSFLSGQQCSSEDPVANSIQNSIEQKGLEPILRVFYHRTAFRLPETHITLDADIAFIREDPSQGNWRRTDIDIDYPFEYLAKKDIQRFPYAVLEIKASPSLPAWLVSLVESHLVHEVPGFSKYLHGISHLYKKQLPLVPWWLSQMQADIRKPRKENLGLSRSRSFKPLIDGSYKRSEKTEPVMRRSGAELNPFKQDAIKNDAYAIEMSSVSQPLLSQNSSSSHVNSSQVFYNVVDSDSKGHLLSRKTLPDLEAGQPKKAVKVKLDPKVFFSNERTFLSWLQFCALLLTVALNLLNFGDNVSRIVGGAFIGIASAVAIYALYRFETRASMIGNRSEGRFDDLWGPAVLCIILVVALLINLYLRFR
ncbi:VTC domain-containing protein [Sporodiniella umbellata]|nr:VTC domain-containing protein [Sporodiniella umbellata]